MDAKLIMNTILTMTKNMSDILYHGTLESSNANVHNAFRQQLDECLNLQNEIYKFMEQKGWYQMQNVEQTKISQTKNKYSGN